MPQRIFLGYSAPFLQCVTDHLLENTEELAETLIIVPTTQSGRTLRENLAATAGAILAPTVTTPGALLHLNDPTIAPRWLEKIAWIEVIESLSHADWDSYSGLFPTPPDPKNQSGDWAHSLAAEIVSLRTSLEESLHNLFTASKFLRETPEQERWENLAELENLMEKKLHAWGYQSRPSALRSGFRLPTEYQKIILAGVTEIPACITEALTAFKGDLTVLIAAPDSEKEHFSDLGIPSDSWAERGLPDAALASICADPASQAEAAYETIATLAADSTQIALGSADDETGAALAHLLSKKGWPAFHPASRAPLPSLQRWLQSWKNWLNQPSSRHLAALLTLPESNKLIPADRAQTLLELNLYRDNHPTIEPEDILEQLAIHSSLSSLRDSIQTLISSREAFLKNPFSTALQQHIASLKTDAESSISTLHSIQGFLDTATPLFNSLKRGNLFWLQILLSELSAPASQPPSDRVIDIQGWLELLYEPGPHLIICGMNETFVPARPGGEPWLSENIRTKLGINSISNRHARDSFLLHAMTRMRETTGSTHLFCGKNGGSHQTLLPSRLLLQVPRKNLADTVKNLFREIHPPEANLAWERDMIWQTPQAEPPQKLYVTSLTDYLSCPFRFYLKHILRATQPDPDRREMNHRDFGSIAHNVLENWGQDPEARKLTQSKKLHDYFTGELQRLAEIQFGHKPPVAVRIQLLAIQQRLQWFAEIQAQNALDGWDILHVERKIALTSNGFTISGKVDRVDQHRETGELRVIDYKTGKVASTEGEHRKKIIASTKIPQHISEGTPAIHSAFDGKKNGDYLWKNLQLPLYALAEKINPDSSVPIPCYIQLGASQQDVKFVPWENFSQPDLDAATACLDWITSSIAQKTFWPPSESVKYDDYALLSQNAPLSEAFKKL
jgi:ATP-dependent helicase/nuclease subunit B